MQRKWARAARRDREGTGKGVHLDGEARGDEHDNQHEHGQLGASHGQSVPQHHDVRVQPHELRIGQQSKENTSTSQTKERLRHWSSPRRHPRMTPGLATAPPTLAPRAHLEDGHERDHHVPGVEARHAPHVERRLVQVDPLRDHVVPEQLAPVGGGEEHDPGRDLGVIEEQVGEVEQVPELPRETIGGGCGQVSMCSRRCVLGGATGVADLCSCVVPARGEAG